MKTGIIDLYYTFIENIKQHKEKFAFLQLTGRIEDFFVREFAYHIYMNSEGRLCAFCNIGKKSEHKIDIAVMKGDIDNEDKMVISGLIEAKYLRNCSRASAIKNDKLDEITSSLKSLYNQLGSFNFDIHGGYSVKLTSRNKEIYGLVFVSYVSSINNDPDKTIFYNSILKNDITKKFCYHDHPKPYLNDVYNDIEVIFQKGIRYVSLKAALWRLKRLN